MKDDDDPQTVRKTIRKVSSLVNDPGELTIDERIMDKVLKDVGTYGYGIQGMSVWIFDDDSHRLVPRRAGWWHNPKVPNSEALDRLVDPFHKDHVAIYLSLQALVLIVCCGSSPTIWNEESIPSLVIFLVQEAEILLYPCVAWQILRTTNSDKRFSITAQGSRYCQRSSIGIVGASWIWPGNRGRVPYRNMSRTSRCLLRERSGQGAFEQSCQYCVSSAVCPVCWKLRSHGRHKKSKRWSSNDDWADRWLQQGYGKPRASSFPGFRE